MAGNVTGCFRKRHHRTVLPQGFGRGLQYSNQFQTACAAAQGLRAKFDAVKEMLALSLQRLFLLDVRGMHVAVVVGVLKFAKSIIMRRTFDPVWPKNSSFLAVQAGSLCLLASKLDLIIGENHPATLDGELIGSTHLVVSYLQCYGRANRSTHKTG